MNLNGQRIVKENGINEKIYPKVELPLTDTIKLPQLVKTTTNKLCVTCNSFSCHHLTNPLD